MTQVFSNDGWRDERLDTLGGNAGNFAEMSRRSIRQQQRSQLAISLFWAGSMTLALACGMAAEHAWTDYNKAQVEAGE